MGRIDKESIGHRQQMIMQCMWDAGQPITVGEIIRRLDEMCGQKFAGPTINTQVQILVNRGLVEQGAKIHQSFTYSPLITREEFQEREIRRFCNLTYNGSPSAVVAAMLRNGISEDELKKIREMINA
ncbi:MAG: BlaI/MecI/CopY family transcriptional regulator [Lachnospiraceae bacterium]|nr:BlaI/MecI/CopY family transcriptional regulator [Lachnospiraceae bacterium]